MNETEKSDSIAEIAGDENDIRCPRSSGDRPGRPGLPTAVKLIALWSLLFGIVIGVPFIFLMSWLGDDWGAGAVVIAVLIFACAHSAASALLFRRLGRKYGVSRWKFVPLSVLPLLAAGIIMYLTAYFIGDWSGLIWAFLGIPFAGYSVVYAVLLSVLLGCLN